MKLGQLIDIVMDNLLKVAFTTFLLVCFSSLTESFCETRKMFFTSKALFVLEKISKNFRSSNFMTSSMLKHKTRNKFYWRTWGVNTVFQWNFASLCYITKENVLSKNSTKNANWKLVSSNLLILYIIPKLWKFVKISMRTSSDSFLKKILWKLKRVWN